MTWIQLSPYCLQSNCKGYTVAKIGGAHGWTYEAYRFKENLAVGFQTADSAKEFCECDYKHRSEAA